FNLSHSEVAFCNGAFIILVVLVLMYTLRILHKFTCYIADRERARIIPIVYYDGREETVNQSVPSSNEGPSLLA
ncbi:hypothetical protein PFISCL1PPCAC_5426, partial [Pristionchus fissidentatus]